MWLPVAISEVCSRYFSRRSFGKSLRRQEHFELIVEFLSSVIAFLLVTVNQTIVIKSKKSNLNDIHCITPKRVTSLLDPSLFYCAWVAQLNSTKYRSGDKLLATVSDLTGPRFELQISRF